MSDWIPPRRITLRIFAFTMLGGISNVLLARFTTDYSPVGVIVLGVWGFWSVGSCSYAGWLLSLGGRYDL